MKWADYVGHLLRGPEGYTVVVEYERAAGLWIVSLETSRMSCISERAVNRTFHHHDYRCSKCQIEMFKLEREKGNAARDIYKRDHPRDRV